MDDDRMMAGGVPIDDAELGAGDAADRMAEIKFIVEALNAPPFNLKLTLIEFHGKAPLELLQIVNDLFTALDPRHKIDLRDEAEDQMATRMLEFLMILNYKGADGRTAIMAEEFREPFLAGEPRIVYPLLLWLLSNQEFLKKKAYLARFLRNVEVPEENFADPQVVSLFQKYKTLQDEFKVVHKAVDKLRLNSVDPSEISRELQQLELERRQLRSKLKRLDEKVKHERQYQDVDFQMVLAQTHALRTEQEEEHKLMEQLEEQKRELIRNQQRRHQTKLKLENQMENAGNPRELMGKLQQEVSQQQQFETRLEANMKVQEAKFKELTAVLSSPPMSEQEIASLKQELVDVKDRVSALRENRDRALAAQNSRMSFYRDGANQRQKKLEKMKAIVEDLLEDKRESEADVRAQQKLLESYFTDGQRPKTDAEMQAYIQGLQAKKEQYKELKKAMQVFEREAATLRRTVEVLKSRDDNVAELNLELEKKHGMEGLQAAQDKLEKVSASKASVDVEKEKTLSEVTELVKAIKKRLEQERSTIAPQIKQFRELQSSYSEVLAEYNAKKTQQDNTMAGLRAERMQIEHEVSGYLQAIRDEESHYHIFHCKDVETEGRKQMLREEAEYLQGRGELGTGGARTYQELIARNIKDLAARARVLNREQKDLKGSHGGKIEQRNMFEDLCKLMQAKQQIAIEAKQKAEEEAKSEITNFMQIADDLADGPGGGERLVINE